MVLGAKNFELQNSSFKTNLNDRPKYGDIFSLYICLILMSSNFVSGNSLVDKLALNGNFDGFITAAIATYVYNR